MTGGDDDLVEWRLLTISATHPAALDTAAGQLGLVLADQPALPIGELARSLARRPAGPHRLALVAASVTEAAEILLSAPNGRVLKGLADPAPPPVVFLYPGVGDHWPGMVAGLYRTVSTFRSAIDTCTAQVRRETGDNLLAALVEPAPTEPGQKQSPSDGPDLAALLNPAPRPEWLDEPHTAQLAVFIVEFALTQVFRQVGIEPAALLGYSIGEYVAAAVAEVLPMDRILSLVARRAQLIEAATAPGGMLAVLLGPDEIAGYLDTLGDRDLVVGAVDGPGLCVVSGPGPTVDKLARLLTGDGVATRRLPVRHAYHSPLLAELEAPLEEAMAGYALNAPRVPMLSNVSGSWLAPVEATCATYWARHMSHPVRFADNLDAMWQLPSPFVLEVGPGRMLSSLALAHPSRGSDTPVLSALPTPARPGSDVPALLTAIGQAWTRGLPVDLDRVTAVPDQG